MTAVYLEVGSRRVFACALDWPGWCRSGKDEERALEALAAYAPRYAVAAAEAGIRFPKSATKAFAVVERLAGNATTDFGAPGIVASGDVGAPTRHERERMAALVEASWRVFDRVAAGAPPHRLACPRPRLGDRGPQHLTEPFWWGVSGL